MRQLPFFQCPSLFTYQITSGKIVEFLKNLEKLKERSYFGQLKENLESLLEKQSARENIWSFRFYLTFLRFQAVPYQWPWCFKTGAI